MKALTTCSIPFYSVSCAPALLSVQAGVEIDEAIEEAGNMVNAALWTLKGVACNLSVEDGGHEAWSALYTLEMADAILHAVSAGLLGLGRPEPTAKPEPAPATDTPKATEPESVCDLLADLDWYLSPSQHRALRRLADERYDGNLKLALAGLFEGALEELEGTTR